MVEDNGDIIATGDSTDFCVVAVASAGDVGVRRADAEPTDIDIPTTDPIDGMGQSNIQVAETPAVMGRERHIHTTVDVEPLGVVLHALGDECDTTHEAPGLIEILERQASTDRVSGVRSVP